MSKAMKMRIDTILKQSQHPNKSQIDELTQLYEDARAAQRAATESGMVDDDGLNGPVAKILVGRNYPLNGTIFMVC